MEFEGSIISIIGLKNRGKTFLMNYLTNNNFLSEKKHETKGLSFKKLDKNTFLMDTLGLCSIVKVENENSIYTKKLMEQILIDIIFQISDHIIWVINDLTALEQRFLDKLCKKMQDSKSKKEIFIIHNLKEIQSQEILDHIWESQVTQIFGNGSFHMTKISGFNPINEKLQEKHISWYKTNYSRHVCIVNDESMLGNNINPWSIALVNSWLKVHKFYY